MTQKQITEAWRTFKCNGEKEEEKQLAKELRCRDTINSILAYFGTPSVGHRLLVYYTSKDYPDFIGEERVNALIAEQLADFANARPSRSEP